MTNYICLLLTSNGCGHCSAFRGDGLINNGKAYMKPEYMKTLFTQVATGSNVHLLNIHYENMSGKANFISDISKFTYTKKGILQHLFFLSLLHLNSFGMDFHVGLLIEKFHHMNHSIHLHYLILTYIK